MEERIRGTGERTRARSTLAFLFLAVGLLPFAGTASGGLPGRGTEEFRDHSAEDTSAGQVIRRIVRDRWIHQDRDPRWVAFERSVDEAHLREISSPSPSREGGFWRVEVDGIEAHVSLDGVGRIGSFTLRPPSVSFSDIYPGPGLRGARSAWTGALQGEPGVLDLPSSRLRSFWIPVPPAPLVTGDEWTDTMEFARAPAVPSPGSGPRRR